MAWLAWPKVAEVLNGVTFSTQVEEQFKSEVVSCINMGEELYWQYQTSLKRR